MLWLLAALAQAATLALAALDIRWVVPLDTPPAAAPAYDASTAYVPLRNGSIVAVDTDHGRVLWRRELATAIAPTVGDGLVFVGVDGGVEALSVAGGDPRWRTPIPGRVITVTWDNGWLLCSNDAGDLAALRASDGELLWRVTLGAPLVLPPAAGLDRVYLALDGGQLIALGLTSGERSWARTLTGRITGLASADGQLIVGTTGKAVFSFALDSGRQRWRWRVGGDVAGAAASDERHVYFAARDNVLRAVDIRSGNLRWTAELPARPVSGPQVLAGRVVVPLANTVGIFDPQSGKPEAQVTVSGEMGAAPHLRAEARPTSTRLVAITLDGRMQGFGFRYEDPPVPLGALPGQTVPP